MTYLGDHTTRSDTVIHSNHTLVIRVLPPPQVVLVAHVVGPLIDHEVAALHPDGVASVEVGVEVGTVAAALVRAPLEVSVLVKYDLKKKAIVAEIVSIFKTQKKLLKKRSKISGIIQ